MPAAPAAAAAPKAEEKKEEAAPPPPDIRNDFSNLVAVLEKSVKTKDQRLMMGRVMRQTALLRKTATAADLQRFVAEQLPAALPARAELSAALDKVPEDAAMQEDGAAGAAPAAAKAEALPEVEMLCYWMVLMHLTDRQHFAPAAELACSALRRLQELNRRTLDVIAARICFYYSWAHEGLGRLAEVRGPLLALHRTAVLRHDAVGAETLLVLLLRSYLEASLYDQAEKFRSKAQVAGAWRSSQQYARYLMYLGRIRAVQLEYSEARECLQQAARKAPAGATGFRVVVNKWLVIVRLLLGEVPERTDFSQPGLAAPLAPYYQLTLAVRNGDLAAFRAASEAHAATFAADGTHNLVTRLHHNVLRTGLRRINLAYSRISLADVAAKLGLPSAEDAECIVAKAIRDGGIDATIDHDGAFLQSKPAADVYSTAEPQAAFHARIAFCLDLHNEAVRAMRYEPGAHKAGLESAEARTERLAAEAELAKALAEEEEEDF